jgi:transcriptional regulator with XRE-family HTH domain
MQLPSTQPLRRIRHARGMSQDALSAESGVTQATISHIETGRTIASMDTLKRLAAVLGCKPYELVAWDDDEEEMEM